jgi:hypothetical protein
MRLHSVDNHTAVRWMQWRGRESYGIHRHVLLRKGERGGRLDLGERNLGRRERCGRILGERGEGGAVGTRASERRQRGGQG